MFFPSRPDVRKRDENRQSNRGRTPAQKNACLPATPEPGERCRQQTQETVPVIPPNARVRAPL
jgi:hypothetical protein